MSELSDIPILKQLFTCLFVLFLQATANAQEETVIDNKGNIIKVRNTIVTTAATAPAAPVQNDIWFDTTAEVTKIYDGTIWLTINLDALATKEDSANKSTDVTLADATDTKFPTELAVKTYIDGRITDGFSGAFGDLTGVPVNLDTDSTDDFDYQGLNDTYFPYYNGTRFVDGRIRQQDGKITMNGAANKYVLNVFGTGLEGRLFFHGNRGDNPGIELATDRTGDRRVLMRLNESGSAGTEIAFYTRPGSGGSVSNYWTMKSDGVFDFSGKGIRKNGNRLQFQKSDNTWQDFDNDGDNNPLNEIQSLSISGNKLTISGTGGNTVTLPDTKLTETEVDDFVSNNGYSTGAHTVDTNTQLSDAEVAVAVNAEFPNLDTDSTDDFDGDFNTLTNVPVNLDTDSTDDFSGDYNDLTNRPAITNLSGTAGSLFFADTDGSATENNTELFWDNANGRLGVGTNTPEAQLDIESEGVPLKIKPSISTPTGTQAGQMFMGDDGILYTYDGSRGKWLSVDRTMVGWGMNGNVTNQYLKQFNGSWSLNNGWRVMRNATITAISVQSNTSTTWTLEIRKNDGNGSITSLNIDNAEGNHNNDLNIDISEGDFLQAYINGTSSNPQALVEIAWRK